MAMPSWRARVESDRLCILREVEIRSTGERIPLTGMPARLVAALASTLDRWCSIGELIDAVWGETPPPTARAALHVHLGVVRRWLSRVPECAAVVERSAFGYRLVLGRLEVDATLAVDLIASSNDLVASDPEVAIQMLSTALAMWRGPEDDNVELSSRMWGARRRLESARLSAEELFVEALLRSGRYGAAESEAARLVEAEPFRELRWGQLLRARYLDNRPHDALQTYQSARDLLRRELGSEPGQLLRDLERAALVHDLPQREIARTARRSTPSMPPASAPIIGRELELARSLELLASRRCIVLLGPPGVGKTRLAQEICVSSTAQDLVVWVDLALHRDPLRATAVALGLPPDSTLPRLCEVLAVPRLLLVFDNAERVADPVARLIEDLRRELRDVSLVITTRVRIPVEGALIEVRPLDVPEPSRSDDALEASPSVRLLRSTLADVAPAITLTREELIAACEHCGGLPLAIRLTAVELRALDGSTQTWTAGAAELGSRVGASLRLLGTRERQAFESLIVVPGEFDAVVGSRLTAVELGDFRRTIMALVDSSLVEVMPGPPVRYRILAPIRDVSLPSIEDTARRVVLDRLADHCITEAHVLAQAIRNGDDMSRTHDEVSTLIGHVRTAMDHLASIGDAERALSLAGRIDSALYTLGWWSEKNDLLDQALAIPGPPTVARARALTMRGRGGLLSGFDLEKLSAAHAMADALGAEVVAAYASHLRCIAVWWAGDAASALDGHHAALATFRGTGREIEELEVLKFIGLAVLHSGAFDDGFRIQREALTRFEQLGIAFHVAHSLALLGHSHRYAGDDEAARVDLLAAASVCAQIDNRATAIHVHLGLGDIAADSGSLGAARTHLAAAFALITRGRLHAYEPWAWTLAMRTAAQEGRMAEALACAQRAVHTLRFAPTGDAARFACELAAIALRLDDYRHAARLLGAARANAGPREIPLPPEAELARHGAVAAAARAALGEALDEHVRAGQRCGVAEAAGDLSTWLGVHLR